VIEHKFFVFRFGDFKVSEREFLLVKATEAVPVEPKAFRVLLFLLRNPGRLVSKDEILHAVWDDCSVSDNSLTRSIATLRRLLGDDAREPRYIATVQTVGYRVLCNVEVSEDLPRNLDHRRAQQWEAESAKPRIWKLGAVLAVLLCVIAAATFWFTKRQPHPVRGSLELKQRQLTTNSSENAVSGGSISPDGKYLAYADLTGIHIKLIETGEMRTVPQPDNLKGMQVNWGIATNWVRDGSRFIANANVLGKPPSIWVIPAMAGAPRKLRDDAYAWAVSRDGSWVAFTANPTAVFYREMWRMRPDGEQATKLYEGDDQSSFFGADWSPDGRRLSYFGGHLTAGKLETSIESRSLKGSPVVVPGTKEVADWTWAPDGRIIYIVPEASPLTGSCNFWETRVDDRTGKAIGLPRRLTNWAGFCMQDPTVAADGKRLAFRKLAPQGTVYVADIRTDGTHIGAARRLTLNEGQNHPFAWTSDSKAVVFESYRDGNWSIFRQSLDDDAAEPIVAGLQGEITASATVSSNGAWLLYVVHAAEDGPPAASAPDQLMRLPIKGGSPELVLTAHIYGKPACTTSSANLCVIAEPTPDRRQLIFTAFDPKQGRGGELTHFNTDPAPGARYVWDLSPDGTRIAILKYSNSRIDVLPLKGQALQPIAVKGWSSLLSLNWASDAKSIFASSEVQKGSVLLRVSLQGDAHVVWKQSGSVAPWNRPFADPASAPCGVPSPDGRRLAIYGWNMSSNMWMIENF
jgi:DNA-binding winged helix-turn-helix (wHTH) protein/Tol biopolymer transport system component